MEREVRLIVRGTVQGVGYRAWLVREATRLALVGTVRNRSDGSVEVLARGPEETLQKLLAMARKGPPTAVVAAVEAVWGVPSCSFNGFTIVR